MTDQNHHRLSAREAQTKITDIRLKIAEAKKNGRSENEIQNLFRQINDFMPTAYPTKKTSKVR